MEDTRFIDLEKVHPDYNVFRYEKFQEDIEKQKINKICMTEIINADMMIATFGLQDYMLGCKEVLTKGKEEFEEKGLNSCVTHYMYNYKNFIIAANDEVSDEDFLQLMQESYNQYMISKSKLVGLHALSRFVVVFGNENIINRARSAFYLHRKSQNNFIVASNEIELLRTENRVAVEVFNLINYAINENKVIPFYQGIHNNESGKIEKYEALMRIADKNGKIFNPSMFLGISKKFKLYSTLSKIMIDKVLTDFNNKKSEVCINLSLLDVQSSEFTNWFISRIKSFSDPKRLTIEFVETENYNNSKSLYDFLNLTRKLGCKIAVDDFGVGFATFTSIISLKPDIIKIDGQIVKDLSSSEDNKTILYSICYMCNIIGSKTVAEFVETDEVQKILINNKISYSQGYHFALPLPITELNVL